MTHTADLWQAIQGGDDDEVARLLQVNPELARATHENGVSLLLMALYSGQGASAERLGASRERLSIWEAAALGDLDQLYARLAEVPDSVNAAAVDGFFPLGLAIFFGHWAAAQDLLAAGADPQRPAQNQMRVTPLHSAAAQRDPQLALELVRLLLAHGAEVNVAQQGGWTPLHQAADHGNLELVELLLARGAEASAQSDDGRTPLALAQAKGHAACVARLEREG